MKHFNKASYFLLLIIIDIILFSSCKKDNSPPVININSPLQDQYFSVGDTIHVVATVFDDEEIKSVTIRLLNSNYNNVGHDEPITVSGNHRLINTQYVIDNQYLFSGNYFLTIVASDGQQVTNSYITIHIEEIPKIRKGIYLLSAPNNFGFDISKIDSFYQPVPQIHVNGDFASSAINSLHHQLYTAGSVTGDFNAFDLNNNTTAWSLPSTSFPVPTFKNLFYKDNRIYVSYYDGHVKGYDYLGSTKFEIEQQGFFIPDIMYHDDQYFFTEIYYPSSHLNKIGVYFLVTGSPRQESLLDIDLRNMYSLDANRLLLFGNDTSAGQGKIELYNINGNGSTTIHTIPTGVLYQVVQVSNDEYLIGHSNGIYIYHYSMNSLTPFITGLPVYSIEYDDLNQEIFAASGNQVVVYNSITANQEYTIAPVDSVLAVHVLYNK